MSTDDEKVVEFIPRSQFDENMDMELTRLADTPGATVRLPREVKRRNVVLAFQHAFELIGGTERLADWANEHPTEFYRLYGKLLPSGSSSSLGESNTMIVKHVLPRGALDE